MIAGGVAGAAVLLADFTVGLPLLAFAFAFGLIYGAGLLVLIGRRS